MDGDTCVPDLTGAPHYHAGVFCERTGFVERRHQRSAGTAAVLSVYGAVHEDGVYKTAGSSFILPAVILIFISGTRTDDVHDPALAGVCRGSRDRRKKEAGETPVDLCRVHCAGVWHKDASRKKLQPCFNNTFGSVGLLANILYAADEEDAERIADQDARVMFELSYRLAKEQGATYQDAPEGFFNRAAHLEKWHDAIKFEMIEEPWRQLHDREGFIDYIPENVESDRIAATIVKSLLPAVLGRWLYDYLALACYGLIRSIAVVHPLLNWYALTAYLAYIVLAALAWRKNHNSNAVWLAAFSLLAVLANVFATSMIIMCLSRYVIYGLPLFYVSGLMLLYELAGGKTAGELKH